MGMSPLKYVQEAVRICEAHLATNFNGRFRLPKRADIGIFRWIIELGRIDIITKVS